MPPASSRHGARDPLGWSTSRPPTTTAHTGPNQLLPWPWHPCYSQARPILSLTMTESTKKRSRATELRCPPAPVGTATRSRWALAVNPQPKPLKHVTGEVGREEAWPLHGSATPQGPHGWQEGVRTGRGMGRRRQHITSETHTGPSFPEVGVRCGLPVSAETQLYNPTARNTARPCSGRVACRCTRLGAAGLSVIALHVPSHRQLVLSP